MSASSASGAKHDRHVAVGDHVTSTQRYVNRKLDELETRLGRRLAEQAKRLNQSITIHYLEKVVEYLSEEMQIHRDLLTTQRDDRTREIEELRRDVDRQRRQLYNYEQTLAHLRAVVDDLLHHQTPLNHSAWHRRTTAEPMFPTDCEEAYDQGILQHVDGFQYSFIRPRSSDEPFKACCYVDKNTSWTVIQRRLDGSVDFYRNWTDYRLGFGQLEGEFWFGNEHIHQLSSQGDYRLRVEMVTWNGQPHWAEYRHFRLSSESDNFRLDVDGFVPGGNAGDSLTSAWDNDHNGQQFSTYDNDNDARFYDNCAQHYRGAWWFRSCFQSHLNGVYYQRGSHNNYFVRNGIQWNTIHPYSSLRRTTMMLRRNSGGRTGLLSNDVE